MDRGSRWVEGGAAGRAEVAGELGELARGGKCEDALDVAEGCEGGDEGDEEFCAVGLEVAELAGCEGGVSLANEGVAFKGEGVFDVELEFVDA